ncbi:flagellar hook-length control protein FliK [Phreatobacter stygius]|uniref:Flagellar hook-length control protein FliK n=1 Tax=Phreatobacter stygius TaxID=1940610 RepID=A0A4D7B7E6_9HYPH|nr:flagellar hook-length control protein FliK [Phreatobacter stygius]QCI63827.1 flagellar hook-length control protein FliK [Phreatobacter stygius]
MSVEGITPVAATPAIDSAQIRALIDALGLKPGQSVEARVAAMISDGIARLVIGDGTLDVRTPQALPVGATLTMTVERQGQALRLLLAAVPGGTAPPASGLPAAPAAAALAGLPAGIPAALPGQAAANVVGALIDLVARESGGARFAGLVDGARATVAARGSSDMSRALEAASAGHAQPATPREALVEAVRAAAARQDSLSPLFADIAAVAEGRASAGATTLPEPVARALAQVLGFRLAAEAAATPAGLARAVAASGTFLEATLATGAAPAADLKVALTVLRGALGAWMHDLGLTGQPQAAPRNPDHERPPLRGALPHGQPPAAASLAAGATPAETASLLIERTEAALARITLLQAASVPDAREIGRPDAPVLTSVEVPIRIGNETAMMQLQIVRERDPEDDAATPATPRPTDWTMRFSMEAEPLGPIHAAVRWRDGHVRVQLWAERDGIAARLDQARSRLSDALEASAFTIDQLTIVAGRPADPRAAPPPARPPRLDRLT